jgi:transcriptional regulator with XRE-family HTH domain
MDDLDRYAQQRAEHDPAFAEGLERESAAFRVGVCLQQAREDAGLTRGEVASRLGTKLTTVGRMETNAGEIRLSTLQAYAELVGQRLVLEVRAAKGAVEKAARAGRLRAPQGAAPRAPRPPRQIRSLSAQQEWP